MYRIVNLNHSKAGVKQKGSSFMTGVCAELDQCLPSNTIKYFNVSLMYSFIKCIRNGHSQCYPLIKREDSI